MRNPGRKLGYIRLLGSVTSRNHSCASLIPAEQIANQGFKKAVHSPDRFAVLAIRRKKRSYSVPENIEPIRRLSEWNRQSEAYVFHKIEAGGQFTLVARR